MDHKTLAVPTLALPAPWVVMLINMGLAALSAYIATTKLTPATKTILQKFITDGEAAITLL